MKKLAITRELTSFRYWLLLWEHDDLIWLWRARQGLTSVPEAYFCAEFVRAEWSHVFKIFSRW